MESSRNKNKEGRGRKARIKKWLFQLENEILIPFLLIGILVICSFAIISYYNGYTVKMKSEQASAEMLLKGIGQDIDYLYGKISQQELREKYLGYYGAHVQIFDGEDVMISGRTFSPGSKVRILASDMDNLMGWKISYWIDERDFQEELLEEQRYVVIGAIASILVIIQASIFIAYNISSPIRNMSETCKEINRNKGNYRDYKFQSIHRQDEIGQLASTFQNLLESMDNYTKMDYTNKMASALAHEIKNPITGIRSGVQVLKRRVERPGDQMLCDSMIKEIDRVTALITNLFTLSVKKDSVKEIFDVGHMLEDLKVFYHKTVEEKAITLSYAVEDKLTCYANPNEIRQILHNLISNSIRAVERGEEGHIRIMAGGRDQYMVMTLEDDGKGMTEEELKMALEPFYTRSINGIGLGLAIVKKLVEQNKGSMKIESSKGVGTRTTLTFYRGEKDEE